MRQGAGFSAFVCALFGALMMSPALASDPAPGGGFIHEVKIGALGHDLPYMWSGFNKEPISVDLNAEVIFGPSIAFWGGTIRPALGATVNFQGYTSKAYIDARWQRECEGNLFYALGIGLAIHDGETFTPDPDRKQLGRQWLFHPHAEIGLRLDAHNSLSVFYEHISNASTASKNQGLDTLGVRYGYRF